MSTTTVEDEAQREAEEFLDHLKARLRREVVISGRRPGVPSTET